jgi:hypothetical protein
MKVLLRSDRRNMEYIFESVCVTCHLFQGLYCRGNFGGLVMRIEKDSVMSCKHTREDQKEVKTAHTVTAG